MPSFQSMININCLILVLFACLSGSTHAWRTYFVSIDNICWRIRLTPNGTFKGWKGDPTCAYFPHGIDSAPPGFKPQPQLISDMDIMDEAAGIYYFKPTTVHPQRGWSGVVTTVMDTQYANTRGVLLTDPILDSNTKTFNITIGIPPAPSESPSIFASSYPSPLPIEIPDNVPVAFKTVHNAYYRAGGARFGYIINQARRVRGWEKFTIIPQDDGNGGFYYVIQTHLGSYIKANVGGTGATVTQSLTIDDTTKFIIKSAWSGDGKVVIETLHGTFFRAIAGRIDQTEDFFEPTAKVAIIKC